MLNFVSEDEKDNTYVFIDFSNIYIGFYNYIINNHKIYNICNPEMNYNMLFSIIEKDKNIKKKVLISSKSKNTKNVKKYKKLEKEKNIFNKLGYEVYVLERINNKEKGVDELLHNKIMESLLYSNTPGSIVIASGDGKPSDYGDNSFYKICVQALKTGWNVTIISWKYQLNKNYIIGDELCNILKNDNIKNKFNIVYLEKYIEMLIK
jgi:hypothetical protein